MQAQQRKTQTYVTLAILAAMAYMLMVVVRIPIVLFLKYEPKDVITTIAGFIFGPFSAFLVAVVVAFFEMLTVSDTGFIGFIMNVIAASAFACTASYIYHKRRTMAGAIVGLLSGTVCMTVLMLLWNYLVTPAFMGVPRDAVVALLMPAFLPFNLLKGGLNATITILLYKPVVLALRRARLMPPAKSTADRKSKINWGVMLVTLFVLGTLIWLAVVWARA